MVLLTEEWKILIHMMSWVYSLCWSCTFYAQIIQNYRVKSVEGMSLNYAMINVNGFFLYTIYTTYGYFISERETGKVDIADLFFAIHALGATSFMIFQTLIYPKGSNILANTTKNFLICQWIFTFIYYLIIKTQIVKTNQNFGYISIIGYFKLICTALKYTPQLLWNYQRKSTFGWSIISIILDLIGGLFSFLQIILQVSFLNESLNVIKLLLGFLTIIFDLLFIHQHYCLYSSVFTTNKLVIQVQDTTLPSITTFTNHVD